MHTTRWLSALVLLTPSLVLAQEASPEAAASEATTTAAPEDAAAEETAPAEEAEEKAAPEEAVEEEAEEAPAEEEAEEAPAEEEAEEAPAEEEAEEAPAEEAEEAPAEEVEEGESADCSHDFKPWEMEGGETWDWVKIDTDEWLKGSIKQMRSGDIDFDSDEFGVLTFSWGDIHTLYSPKLNVYVTTDNEVFKGTAVMAEGKLVVTSEDGVEQAIEQAELLSVVSHSKREIGNWDFKATLGVTWRQGNTESFDYTGYARLRREDAFNRARLQYDGAFGEVAGELNTNKHRGQAAWDLFISPIFYLTPVIGDIQFDEFQNLDVRWTLAAGAGVHVVDTSNVSLDLELAGGFTQTNYLSVPDTEDGRRDDALIRPRVYFDWDITDDVEWEFDWSTSIIATDVEYTFHHAETRLSVELTDILDLMYSAIYDRQETTVELEDGTIPVNDDIAMTLSLGVELD